MVFALEVEGRVKGYQSFAFRLFSKAIVRRQTVKRDATLQCSRGVWFAVEWSRESSVAFEVKRRGRMRNEGEHEHEVIARPAVEPRTS